MGGKERVKRQHDTGRLTVRERIEKLLDPDSFEEWGALAGFAEYDKSGELKEFVPANNVVGTGRVEARDQCLGDRRLAHDSCPCHVDLGRSRDTAELALDHPL